MICCSGHQSPEADDKKFCELIKHKDDNLKDFSVFLLLVAGVAVRCSFNPKPVLKCEQWFRLSMPHAKLHNRRYTRRF